jgi:hypothetical protein
MLSERCWRLRSFIAIESSDPAPARSIPIDLSFGLFKLGRYRFFPSQGRLFGFLNDPVQAARRFWILSEICKREKIRSRRKAP